jgi:hypothetical protein
VNVALGSDVRLLPLLVGFVVPGLAFYFRMPGLVGKIALAWAGLLFIAYLALLGSPWDNYIFAMLLSVHVSGFVLYCNPLLSSALPARLLFTPLMLLLMLALLYWPAQAFADAYLVTPLQWRGNVVVVHPLYATDKIRPGDWLAYRTHISTEDHLYSAPGIDFAPVLAGPGDRVTFSASSYSINGVEHRLLPHMPQHGSFVVPQKEWFVWPNVAIDIHHLDEATVSSRLVQTSMVTEDQLIGVPFQRWFWRKQNFS